MKRAKKTAVAKRPMKKTAAPSAMKKNPSATRKKGTSKNHQKVGPYFRDMIVKLNYQKLPPSGFRTGRYINCEDRGDTTDAVYPEDTMMHNARKLSPEPTVDSVGFELRNHPTKVKDFLNAEEVERVYYQEMRTLLKQAVGADRVLIFDHTVRNTGNKNLNAVTEASAAAVMRVHADYTAESAPDRLKQLAKNNIWSYIRNRHLTEDDFADLMTRRFAVVNVWRNISKTPVMRSPLGVCDANSVPDSDRFLYELIFADRIGKNYSLQSNPAHKWYHYPQMVKDECLLFKTYDKMEDRARFCFHTAFEYPKSVHGDNVPNRESIEIRAFLFFDH